MTGCCNSAPRRYTSTINSRSLRTPSKISQNCFQANFLQRCVLRSVFHLPLGRKKIKEKKSTKDYKDINIQRRVWRQRVFLERLPLPRRSPKKYIAFKIATAGFNQHLKPADIRVLVKQKIIDR